MADGVVDLVSTCDACGHRLLMGQVVRLVGNGESGAIARHEQCWPPAPQPLPDRTAPVDRMLRKRLHRVDL
jgi:hypothetical protein